MDSYYHEKNEQLRIMVQKIPEINCNVRVHVVSALCSERYKNGFITLGLIID